MRKVLILLGLVLTIGTNGFSQTLNAGEQTAGIGIGIPAISNYAVDSKTPSITGFYEYGFTDKVGIGHIGGGAIFSFAGADYRGGNYRYSLVGPRASYHFDMTDITGDKAWDVVDVYAGIMSGLRFERVKYDYTDVWGDKQTYKETETNLITDIFVGIRYAFADQFGVYAEAGYGVSYLTVGVSYRF